MKPRLFYSIGLLIFFMFPMISGAQESIKENEELDFAQGLLSRGMYDMAILQCQKFIADYPHSSSLPQAYLSLGEGYFLSKDLSKASDTFNQFKKLYPDSKDLPVGLLRLGQIDIESKKYDEALKNLTSIDAQKQLQGPLLQSFDFYTAQAYLNKGDLNSALSFFQKASNVQGAGDYTPYALKEEGRIDVNQGHYSQAIDAYMKAVSLAKDDSLAQELRDRIAEAQFMAGNYIQAIDGFKQLLAQNPSSDMTQNVLANLLLAYFNSGQYDQLLTEYQKDALRIKDDKAYFEVHFAAVLAYIELKKYDEANGILDHLLKLADLSPLQKARIYVKKAIILIKQQKYKDGLALLETYASTDVNDLDEIAFFQGQAYFGAGDFAKALKFFENVYLNFPTSRFAKAALLGEAHTQRQLGQLKESEALFLKYYGIQDQVDLKRDALYDAVMVAIKAGDIPGSISAAQEYLKVFPKEAQADEVLLLLADQEGKNNQPLQAVQLLQGYLAQPSPQRPNTANFLLGFNQALLGHTAEAMTAYEKVDPNKEGGQYYAPSLKNMAIIDLNLKNFDQARTYFDTLMSRDGQNDLQIKTYVWVCNEYLKQSKYNDVLRIAELAQKHFSQSDLLEVRYFKAEALRGLGRCDDAAQDYDFVMNTTPKDAFTGSAHIGQGLCWDQAGKYDNAKQEFQKALDENADDYSVTVHARFEMANADFLQGNLDEALRFYLLVATIYDDEHYCSESLLKAGRIFELQQRPQDALKMYSEILDRYKNSPAAADARQRIGSLK